MSEGNLVETMHETLKHIRRVQELMQRVVDNLITRAIAHDLSKLSDPEVAVFAEYTPHLKELVYGSPEYRECLRMMQPALDHHYSHNAHHPEFHPTGVNGMSLLDLIEHLVDCKAASERHATGDIQKSITINKPRFGYSDQLESILRATVQELFPSFLEPWRCYGCGAGGCTFNFCYQCGAGRGDYKAE